VAAVAVLGLTIGIWIVTRTSTSVATGGEAAPASSIAVLPFRSPPGNPSLAPLAEGITADLRSALANSMRAARIVTAGSPGELRKITDSRALGRELNVRYLIDGELQAMRDGLLITMRIVEADSGQQIGGERRETTVSKWDVERRPLIAAMTDATREAIWRADVRRVAAGKTTGTPADLVVQGNASLQVDWTLASAREARKFYDRALKADPQYVPAWIGRGWTFVIEFENDWTDGFDRDRVVREVDEASRRATDLDDRDPRAWRLRAIALGYQWNWPGAFEAIDRGRRLDPTRPELLFQRALFLTFTARPAEALQVIEEHNRLGGSGDPAVLRLACRAHLALGDYDTAIDECERGVAVEKQWIVYFYLTAAYSLKGDMPKAANAMAQLVKTAPGFTIARFEHKQFFNHPEVLKWFDTVIYPALIKAGVPQ
jgi:TolB-like protein